MARWSILLILSAFLAACASTKQVQPWLKDGQKVGTITTLKQPKGYHVVYRDVSNKVVRFERRDAARNLLPGACITVTDYDAQGRPEQFKFLDATEKPVVGTQGFSVHRFEYGIGDEQNPVVTERFLDAEEKPVSLRAGYAVLRRTQEPAGRLKKVEFFGPSGAAAPSTWLGITNIVRVDYAYLEGVGEVTCAVFFDASGKVVARRQLTGVAATAAASYSAPPGGFYMPPPAYMPPPRPVAPPPPRIGPR